MPTNGDVNVYTVGNPKNFEFVRAAPDLQARAVPDVDLAILDGNYWTPVTPWRTL